MIYAFVPEERFWTSQRVVTAVKDAQDASRRIQKGIDVARETVRLGVALRAIDNCLIADGEYPKLLQGNEALLLMEGLPRIGPVRLPFAASPSGKRFFLTAVPFGATPEQRPQLGAAAQQTRPTASEPGSDYRGHKVSQRLLAARAGNGDVFLGGSRHTEITRALRAHLHASSTEQPFDVRFVYKDGSAGRYLHLRRHASQADAKPSAEFSIGLESCRHFDLDAKVDFYLLRNTDLQRRDDQTFAEQEIFVYARAGAAIDQYCGEDGLHIRFFHTGVEPAVIGFYRAVIDALISGRKLRVTPMFYSDGKEEEAWS